MLHITFFALGKWSILFFFFKKNDKAIFCSESWIFLWRSRLVFHWWQICILGNPPLPNPFGDPNLSQPIMPIQQNVADILFVRTSYVKKIIEDCSNSEETVKLLRFCCWENPQFSSTVLSELLWQVKGKYTFICLYNLLFYFYYIFKYTITLVLGVQHSDLMFLHITKGSPRLLL